MEKIRLAIFASGGGTNALKLLQHFEQHSQIEIVLLASNNANAGVFELTKKYTIKHLVFDKQEFTSTQFAEQLKTQNIDWIVLAGFLWLIPTTLINAFPDRIINIHPALLPLYGGKGMYGNYVHEAVLAAKEDKTGITIHLVNNEYDKGAQLFQASAMLHENETLEAVRKKVQVLEHQFFAGVVESVVLSNSK